MKEMLALIQRIFMTILTGINAFLFLKIIHFTSTIAKRIYNRLKLHLGYILKLNLQNKTNN